MGKGVAIEPSTSRVVAPFDGSVVMLAPSKHAIGLRSQAGVELLIHVGLDTVKLNGEPFTLHVKEGDAIKTGDLLLEYDQKAIEAAGLKTTTPVIVTNTSDFSEIIIEEKEQTKERELLLTVVN